MHRLKRLLLKKLLLLKLLLLNNAATLLSY
jgi:hypothetical protein